LKDLIEFSSAWAEIAALLKDRKSVIVIAPRYYRKWTILQKYANTFAAESTVKCVILSSRVPTLNGDIEYSRLWEEVRSQLGSKKTPKSMSRASFLNTIESSLAEIGSHVMVFIGGAGRGHEENHYRVLSSFQSLLRTGKLTIATTDDYSSLYFQKPNFLLSDLHSLLKLQIGPTNTKEISAYLTNVPKLQGVSTEWMEATAERIYRHSGGHTGIAQEILSALERESWQVIDDRVDSFIEEVLKRSIVLESITHALEEDAEGYSHTALEYRSASCPEQNSPRIHVLRQLGVLQREDPPLLRLCGGAITRLVEALSQRVMASRPARVGTIMSEAGPRIFEEGAIELTDDDLVILHVSDLHVGDQYKHRLAWTGGVWNPNEQSAGELLRDDLQSLGLLGRVDGMVLSGDFVWTGVPTEFRRAKNVIEEMLSEIDLDLARVILIPGNHDMEWNPGNFSSPSYGKPVSRESYDDFIKLLGKASHGELEVLHIESRSANVKLQILGLDSNRVEGPEAAGIGFVSRDALMSAKNAISKFNARPTRDGRFLTWIVVHHHIFPATSTSLANAQGRIVSTMANAAEVLDFANQWKVEVILHGHEHQPSVTVARRWPIDVGYVFAPIASIGAGSFGVKREYLGPFSRNHYYVIVRRQDGMLIRSREQGTGGVKFVTHSDMWLPR
jgi:calcineurin-like phosphoesterase family protein